MEEEKESKIGRPTMQSMETDKLNNAVQLVRDKRYTLRQASVAVFKSDGHKNAISKACRAAGVKVNKLGPRLKITPEIRDTLNSQLTILANRGDNVFEKEFEEAVIHMVQSHQRLTNPNAKKLSISSKSVKTFMKEFDSVFPAWQNYRRYIERMRLENHIGYAAAIAVVSKNVPNRLKYWMDSVKLQSKLGTPDKEHVVLPNPSSMEELIFQS